MLQLGRLLVEVVEKELGGAVARDSYDFPRRPLLSIASNSGPRAFLDSRDRQSPSGGIHISRGVFPPGAFFASELEHELCN